ncbi:hypothetical protein Tco_0389764 [Tanacetum coccineum]
MISCYKGCFIIGTSNGLVCLLSADAKQILIANPSTRQVEQHLPASPINIPNATHLRSGFGYDFLTDDYKVIVDHKKKVVIVSFDLSKEEFKEIPQPDDSRYQYNFGHHQLAIMNECLSICDDYGPDSDPSDDIFHSRRYDCAPIFVRSLVSPHVKARQSMNKRHSNISAYFYLLHNNKSLNEKNMKG